MQKGTRAIAPEERLTLLMKFSEQMFQIAHLEIQQQRGSLVE